MSKVERPFVPLNVAVLTLSDTRTLETDSSGALIIERLQHAGHRVAQRVLLREDLDTLRGQFRAWVADPGIDVVIATGGTGMTQRDITPEAVAPLLTKPIPGFGELFRWLSYSEIGTSTIQSRAQAGIADGTLLFLLPGSTGACRLAMDSIILSQLDARQRPCNFVELLPRIRREAPPGMSERLTHLDETGAARMVDVGDKPETDREAVAEGHVRMQPETLHKILAHTHKKGDVLATARIAGILAAKRTAELVPLCHTVPLTAVDIEFTAHPDQSAICCRAAVCARARTGVEMEALAAVEIALLTIYDMCKAVDRGMTLTDIGLLSKSGGRSGTWVRPKA